jgi:hypothetical protein
LEHKYFAEVISGLLWSLFSSSFSLGHSAYQINL